MYLPSISSYCLLIMIMVTSDQNNTWYQTKLFSLILITLRTVIGMFEDSKILIFRSGDDIGKFTLYHLLTCNNCRSD